MTETQKNTNIKMYTLLAVCSLVCLIVGKVFEPEFMVFTDPRITTSRTLYLIFDSITWGLFLSMAITVFWLLIQVTANFKSVKTECIELYHKRRVGKTEGLGK
jgi:hypothetical protein